MNTRQTMRPRLIEGQRSEEGSSTRDKLAARLTRLDSSVPDALDLLARALDAGSEQLRGVAGQVAGPRGPDHFRRVWRGEEAGAASEIARLALDGRKEPRAAVRAFLTVIANAAGYSLEPLPATDGAEIHEAMAARCVADATLNAEIWRDLKDGELSAEECADLEPELADARARLLKVEAAVAQARANALRRDKGGNR